MILSDRPEIKTDRSRKSEIFLRALKNQDRGPRLKVLRVALSIDQAWKFPCGNFSNARMLFLIRSGRRVISSFIGDANHFCGTCVAPMSTANFCPIRMIYLMLKFRMLRIFVSGEHHGLSLTCVSLAPILIRSNLFRFHIIGRLLNEDFVMRTEKI